MSENTPNIIDIIAARQLTWLGKIAKLNNRAPRKLIAYAGKLLEQITPKVWKTIILYKYINYIHRSARKNLPNIDLFLKNGWHFSRKKLER